MDFYPRSHRVEALSVDGRCLSVPCVPDSRSSMEGHSKLKTDRKKALDPGDFRRQLLNGQGHQAAKRYRTIIFLSLKEAISVSDVIAGRCSSQKLK